MTENKLAAGSEAPEFTVETTDGSVNLKDLVEKADKGVVVYFYPRAMTPGCTTEACDFRDNLNILKGAGYTVIGISPDPIARLEKFKARDGLNFLLGSDPDHAIMTRWGTWGQKKNYGRIFQGVIRSTFVVDKTGKISVAQYNVRAKGHVLRLLKALGI